MNNTFSYDDKVKVSSPNNKGIKEIRTSLQTTVTLDEIVANLHIKEGFLQKKTNGLLKRWVNRYFVLDHLTLSYFYDKKQIKLGGALSFENLQVSAYLKSNKIYLIITNSRRFFKLKAKNEDIARSWYVEIEKQTKLASGKIKSKELAMKENFWKVPRISVDDFAKSVKTGDLMLFTGHHFVGSAQRLVTRSKFDHVGMFFAMQGSIFLLQAVIGGVCVLNWSELLNDIIFTENYNVWYRSLEAYISREKKKELKSFINKVINKKFRFSIKEFLFKTKDANLDEQKGFFCSELVASAYKILGVLPQDPASNKYWPGDFSSEHNIILIPPARMQKELLIDKHL